MVGCNSSEPLLLKEMTQCSHMKYIHTLLHVHEYFDVLRLPRI